MPFTFSHPALVLPLALLPRRWYSLTGLVIGSVGPDFEYFLRMRVRSDYSHTLSGVLWFDLPLGLLLALLFHGIVRDPFIANLPSAISQRFSDLHGFSFSSYLRKHWFVVALSIIAGAFSHLLWDGFTHETGYFVGVIPALGETLQIGNWRFPAFKVAQHLSTLAGAAVFAVTLWKLPRRGKVAMGRTQKYWLVWAAVVGMVLALRAASGLSIMMYGHWVATGISASLLGLVITPLVISRRDS